MSAKLLYLNQAGHVHALEAPLDGGNYTFNFTEENFVFALWKDGVRQTTTALTLLEQYACSGNSIPFQKEKKDLQPAGRVLVIAENLFFLTKGSGGGNVDLSAYALKTGQVDQQFLVDDATLPNHTPTLSQVEGMIPDDSFFDIFDFSQFAIAHNGTIYGKYHSASWDTGVSVLSQSYNDLITGPHYNLNGHPVSSQCTLNEVGFTIRHTSTPHPNIKLVIVKWTRNDNLRYDNNNNPQIVANLTLPTYDNVDTINHRWTTMDFETSNNELITLGVNDVFSYFWFSNTVNSDTTHFFNPTLRFRFKRT